MCGGDGGAFSRLFAGSVVLVLAVLHGDVVLALMSVWYWL